MPSRNGHTRNSYVTARDPNAVYKSKAVPDGSKGLGWQVRWPFWMPHREAAEIIPDGQG